MVDNELYNSYVIDVANIAKKVLSKWKRIIIVSVILALLVSVMQYVLVRVEYNRLADESVEDEQKKLEYSEEEIQKMLDELTQEETMNLEYAKSMREQIGMLEEYMRDSIYYNTDAYNEDVVSIHYYIDISNNEYKDEAARRLHANSFEEAYYNYVYKSDIANRIVEKLGWDIRAQYVRDLLSATANDDENVVFVVAISGNENYSAIKIAEVVKQLMEEYSETLKKTIGEHELVHVETSHRVVYDSTLAQHQDSLRDKEWSLKVNLEKLVKNFSEPQMAIYLHWYENASVDESIESDTEITDGPTFSVSLFIIGFVVCVLLLSVIEAFRTIFSNKVDTVDTIEKTFGVHVLGDLTFVEKKKCVVDNLIDKMFSRNKLDISQRVNYTVTNLKVVCKKLDINKLVAISTISFDENELVYVEELVAGLKKEGIEFVLEQSSASNTNALEALRETEQVILVERLDVTDRKMLKAEIALCEKQGEDILGVLLV